MSRLPLRISAGITLCLMLACVPTTNPGTIQVAPSPQSNLSQPLDPILTVGTQDLVASATPAPEIAPVLSGQVADQNGQPVLSVEVVIRRLNQPDVLESQTATDGRFEFQELPRGELLQVEVSKAGFTTQITTVLLEADIPQTLNFEGDLALRQLSGSSGGISDSDTATPQVNQGTSVDSGTISGLVINQDTGAGESNITVMVEGLNLSTTTDFQGRYILENVPVGNHQLRASAPGFEANSGQAVSVLKNKTLEAESLVLLTRHWFPQSTPTSALLRALHFTDTQNGWAVGGSNALLHTTNGGDSWSQVPGNTGNWIGVYFSNATDGVVLGEDGTVLVTFDGGNQWNSHPIDAQALEENIPLTCSRMEFVNAFVGYARCDELYTTSNGGLKWTKLPNAPSGGNAWDFFNESQGIMGGYFTANAGKQFDPRPATPTLERVQYITPTHIYGSKGGTFHASRDGGNSWDKVSLPLSGETALYFLNAERGWIASPSQIMQTSDGGKTWIDVPRGDDDIFNPTAFYFVDETHGWLVGESGKILKY